MGMHIGRHWPNEYKAEARGANSFPTIEEQCPCPREPCGCIDSDKVNVGCEQHPMTAAKTMRTMHDPDNCPGAPVEV
jgi:hypothetical protein